MKLLNFLLMLMAFTATPFCMYADDVPDTELRPQPTPDRKKRMPARPIFVNINQHLFKVTDFGGHTMIDVEIEDEEGMMGFVVVTETSPTADIYLPAGCYTITATAENGATYRGEACVVK